MYENTPQYYPPAGSWVPPGPPLPESSGYRVAAGVIAIVHGSILLTPSLALVGFAMREGQPAASALVFVALAAAVGNLISGIVLISRGCRRGRAAPAAVMACAAFPAILGVAGFALGHFHAVLLTFSLIFAVPVAIILGVGLVKEKRGH